MTRERGELEVSYGSRFEERLRRLPEARRSSCLRHLIDVVTHDDIVRYSAPGGR